MISAFKVGPFVIHLYGLIIAVSIMIGYFLARRRALIHSVPKRFFESPWLILPLIFGVLGGRIYHVLDKWQYYQSNPGAIVDISRGGLGIWGSLAGIALGLWILSKRGKIKFTNLLDLVCPSLILGQGLGRFGNYINQEGFGPPTNLPWAVPIDLRNRPEQYMAFERFHPTFFYEMALDLLVFVILLLFARRRGKSGQVFGLYLVLYGLSRLITEFYRIDTAVLMGVKVALIFSLAAIVGGMVILAKLRVDKT